MRLNNYLQYIVCVKSNSRSEETSKKKKNCKKAWKHITSRTGAFYWPGKVHIRIVLYVFGRWVLFDRLDSVEFVSAELCRWRRSRPRFDTGAISSCACWRTRKPRTVSRARVGESTMHRWNSSVQKKKVNFQNTLHIETGICLRNLWVKMIPK